MQRPHIRLIALGWFVLLCACSLGCETVKEVKGNSVRFSNPDTTGYILIAVCALLVPICVLAARWKGLGPYRYFGYPVAILGIIVAVVFGPTLLRSHVLVDDKHFAIRVGPWFAANDHTIEFNDLSEIQTGMEEYKLYDKQTRTHRISEQPYLIVVQKSGQPVKISVGDLVKPALPEIVKKAQASGVSVVKQNRPVQ